MIRYICDYCGNHNKTPLKDLPAPTDEGMLVTLYADARQMRPRSGRGADNSNVDICWYCIAQMLKERGYCA